LISSAPQMLRLTTCCIILLLAALTAAGQSDLASTEQDIAKLIKAINGLETGIKGDEKRRAQAELDLQRVDKLVAQVAGEVEQARAKLADTNSKIAGIEAEQTQLDTQRRTQAEHIAEHLAASYRMSGEDYVKLLLNQQSPEQLNRLMRYHRYFTEARMEVIQDYQRTLDQMADNRFRLETQREDAQRKQRTLADEQRKLTRERAARETKITELTAQVESKSAQLRRLNNDRDRLETLLAELRRRATQLDGGAFVANRGKLPWPIMGRLVNAFGQSRADGRLSWTGIVIAADEGEPIKAVFRGRVVFADALRGFGLLTIVDHGGGYLSLYGHADILLKTEGEWVESGEVIARAGNSGAQARTGLYFEVRHKGVARDPIGWLAKR
jgi:septal ring factor EnvC (AmiA/AmiB activator)